MSIFYYIYLILQAGLNEYIWAFFVAAYLCLKSSYMYCVMVIVSLWKIMLLSTIKVLYKVSRYPSPILIYARIVDSSDARAATTFWLFHKSKLPYACDTQIQSWIYAAVWFLIWFIACWVTLCMCFFVVCVFVCSSYSTYLEFVPIFPHFFFV